MVDTRGFARLGMLAVGLGVGAAMAHSPVASADSSTDWLSSIDTLLSGGALPAPSSGLDLAISFDGYSLVQDGSAFGRNQLGGVWLGDRRRRRRLRPGRRRHRRLRLGRRHQRCRRCRRGVGDTGANYDTAIDIGNNDVTPMARDGAYAGDADLAEPAAAGPAATTPPSTSATTPTTRPPDGAFAGAGGLTGGVGDGNNDTAIDVGNNSGRMTAPSPSTATVTTPACPAAPPVWASMPTRAGQRQHRRRRHQLQHQLHHVAAPSATTTTPPSWDRTTALRWPITAIPTSPTSWTPSAPPPAKPPPAMGV